MSITVQGEPVAIANSVAALVELILIAAIAFGLDLTTEQVVAITAVIVGVGQTVATIFGRSRVTPVA